jgi:hypothetical protein
MELALRQQEVQRLQHQLGDAEDRARRAEESTSAIRWAKYFAYGCTNLQ